MGEGLFEGDVCNRDGCQGIIEAAEKEGSCSCHIHPPCGYCTTQIEFCPQCNWDAEEEKWEAEASVIRSDSHSYYNREVENYQKQQAEFLENYRSKKIFDTFESRYKGHTHFSMEYYGWFPPYMTKEELITKIRGTFGGRFVSYNKEIGRFRYIAYTD